MRLAILYIYFFLNSFPFKASVCCLSFMKVLHYKVEWNFDIWRNWQDSVGGYMVAFAGRRYAARSPPAFVANSTYTVTSFTLVS